MKKIKFVDAGLGRESDQTLPLLHHSQHRRKFAAAGHQLDHSEGRETLSKLDGTCNLRSKSNCPQSAHAKILAETASYLRLAVEGSPSVARQTASRWARQQMSCIPVRSGQFRQVSLHVNDSVDGCRWVPEP